MKENDPVHTTDVKRAKRAWEIEGFLLTVGDGCRKLGGHDQEMILRRNGDSCLLNDESESVLQG